MKLIAILACALTLIGASFAQPKPDLKAKQAELTKLEQIYKKSKASAVKAKPGTPKMKEYVAATVAYGNCVMMSPVLTPKDKYPKALSLFREALKSDPSNKVALDNKNMIEQIYKSMNRPIPKG
jgi:hypothetical protein